MVFYYNSIITLINGLEYVDMFTLLFLDIHDIILNRTVNHAIVRLTMFLEKTI